VVIWYHGSLNTALNTEIVLAPLYHSHLPLQSATALLLQVKLLVKKRQRMLEQGEQVLVSYNASSSLHSFASGSKQRQKRSSSAARCRMICIVTLVLHLKLQ